MNILSLLLISLSTLLGSYQEPSYIETTNIAICSPSSVKTYMDYKKITNKASIQYRYIQDNMVVRYDGHLIDEEDYIGVALGSYFGKIGTRYIITLSSGQQLKVIKVEAKDDKHTFKGCQQRWDKSVIEFVVDVDKAGKYYGIASNGYVNSGNFNNLDQFKGNIIKIEEVRR